MHILLYALWLSILLAIILTSALTQRRYIEGYIKAHRLDPTKVDPQGSLNPWEGQRRALSAIEWLGEQQEDPALERLRGRTFLWLGIAICWGLGGFIVQVLWTWP